MIREEVGFFLARKSFRRLSIELLEEVTSQLSVSADQATKWYESNLLAGNKYQTLNIGYSKKTDSSANTVIYANNQEIKTIDTLKLLGVTIDSKLNFSEHVSSACKMASQRIGVLMRLRNLIPTYSYV